MRSLKNEIKKENEETRKELIEYLREKGFKLNEEERTMTKADKKWIITVSLDDLTVVMTSEKLVLKCVELKDYLEKEYKELITAPCEKKKGTGVVITGLKKESKTEKNKNSSDEVDSNKKNENKSNAATTIDDLEKESDLAYYDSILEERVITIPTNKTQDKEDKKEEKRDNLEKEGKKGLIYSKVLEIVNEDILEIFGESGSGKTSFCFKLAKECQNSNIETMYIDTEKNLSNEQIKQLKNYRFALNINDLKKEIIEIEQKKPKVVIIDSIGMPFLRYFSELKLNERGNALLEMIRLTGRVKEYANKNGALVIITNQPESEFMKNTSSVLKPFGDKHIYLVKEIWKCELVNTNEKETVSYFLSFRSRKFGRGKRICALRISKEIDCVFPS